jgi:hypothetical protein
MGNPVTTAALAKATSFPSHVPSRGWFPEVGPENIFAQLPAVDWLLLQYDLSLGVQW